MIRLEWHLSVPACSTLTGLIRHLSLIGMSEVQQLCYELHADGLIELTKVMWRMIKSRRKKASTHSKRGRPVGVHR